MDSSLPFVNGAAERADEQPFVAVGHVICELPMSVIAPFSCAEYTGGLNGSRIAASDTDAVEITTTPARIDVIAASAAHVDRRPARDVIPTPS
jgi:hypothetical protein